MTKNISYYFLKIPRMIYLTIRNHSNKSRYPFVTNRIDPTRETVILISHSSLKGGAPLLLANIALQIRKTNIQVVIISRDYGGMIPLFIKNSDSFKVCITNRELNKYILNMSTIKCIGFICNSVMSADVIPTIIKCGYNEVTLIHEMKNAIVALNAEKLARIAATKSKCLIFPSEYVVDSFKDISMINVPYYIRPQGVYLSDFGSGIHSWNKDSMIIKKYTNESLQFPIVLNIASSSYRKGFDIFMKLAQLNPTITFIWIGFQENRFTKRIMKNGKPENLFLIGYITDSNVLFAFYRSANVFALTSREEPFGSVVLEAFSVGLPVVAFDNCGGFVDIIRNKGTGILVNQVSAVSMSFEINKLLKLDNQQISQNCKRIAASMTFSNYVDFILNKLKEQ